MTDDHHLVVGSGDLPGVLVFDLHAGGAPSRVLWPAPLTPVDMAAGPEGCVWILDGPPGPGPARLWCLDRRLRIADLAGRVARPPRAADFVASASAGPPPDQPVPGAGSPAPVAAEWPVAVEALPDGSVLVLDRGGVGPARISRHRGGREAGGWPLSAVTEPVDLAWTPAPGGGVAGTVVVADSRGDQATAFELSADGGSLRPLARYLPMRLFSGKGLVAGGGQVRYDLEDRWLPLVERHAPRYRTSGTVVVGPFDAGSPGTVWHRLAIDGRMPVGTAVRVESRTADEATDLERAPWREEPDPYRRGRDSEVPYHRVGAAGAPDTGTWEILLQRAVGRFVQVRLTLTGDGRHTPRLWALRVHGPRFSYLRQYLPDLYREDPDSAGFLDRYLAIVEGLLTTLEGQIAGAQVLFDVTALDARHLAWLGTWLGVTVDPGWDQARVRLLLKHAVELHGRRGTVRGLVEAIRLATDPHPDSSIFDGTAAPGFTVRVVEAFTARSAPGPSPATGEEPAPAAGPRLVTTGRRWLPADGRSELDRRYREHVLARHASPAGVAAAWGRHVATAPDGTLTEPFRPLTPCGPTEARDRAEFLRASVGVPYADVSVDDRRAYRQFLAQRYRRTSVLSAAWGLAGGAVPATFEQVDLPCTAVPPDGVPLRDWLEFVGMVLPALRAAHRFTVLVPVQLDEPDEAQRDHLARVAQVVERERPAHTAYEIRPYWAAFQVGAARIGAETTVGPSSRFAALVLGEGRLAGARVGGRSPWDVSDRWVVGRDRIGRRARDGGTEPDDG
ncbi:phage tail protein [Geodermatophilus sp. SYSU D00803]